MKSGALVNHPLEIIALGEPLFEFSQIPNEPRHYLQGFGGDTSNMAIAASRLGAKVAYLTRVGADEFGQQLLALWRDEGVDCSSVAVDPHAPTGGYFITHGTHGHQFSYLRSGSAASRMRAADVPADVIGRARFFYASGISQAISDSACDAVFTAIDAARNAGVRVAYDSNLRLKLWPLARARAVIASTAALADLFLPSLDDATALSGFSDPDAIIDWAHALGAPIVLLRMGANGVRVSDGGARTTLAGLKVATVDATGAGDCFNGALLARLAAGDDLLAAARYANAAAALSTTGFGAIASYPRSDAVGKMLIAQ